MPNEVLFQSSSLQVGRFGFTSLRETTSVAAVALRSSLFALHFNFLSGKQAVAAEHCALFEVSKQGGGAGAPPPHLCAHKFGSV